MKKRVFIWVIIPIFAGCARKATDTVVITTTEHEPWIEQRMDISPIRNVEPDIVIDPTDTLQRIEGFGACFNELGWVALSGLDPDDRQRIMKDLFQPGAGCSFNLCRMPVGANDFSIDWYSYCETDGDYDMVDFSIERDRQTLIPFIRNALEYNPELQIWASPWSPPTWMKHNRHYACRPNPMRNDLAGDPKTNREGSNMFITEPLYYEAYARYFARFIESYRDEGIHIFAVAPQNEFNSCQVFPSCTWTAASLRDFIGTYLGPEMERLHVGIILGTLERENYLLADTVLSDPDAGQYVDWVGFQWRGKGAVSDVHNRYPDMKLIQTESECGDGKNDWTYCLYTWDLMKHYLRNGANAYEYWNIALVEDGLSRWGWRQNSLLSVDCQNGTYKYNHEYYLMKHVAGFVERGARLLRTTGNFDDALAFVNPDGKLVVVLVNRDGNNHTSIIRVGKKQYSIPVGANSINTLVIKGTI